MSNHIPPQADPLASILSPQSTGHQPFLPGSSSAHPYSGPPPPQAHPPWSAPPPPGAPVFQLPGFAPPPQPFIAPPPPAPRRELEAIPAPALKAAYAPPVFKTFQERRREKEEAMRAAGLGPRAPAEAGPSTYSAPVPPARAGPAEPAGAQPPTSMGPPAVPASAAHGARPQPAQPAFTPSPAALAMLGSRTAGDRPTPPPRSRTPSVPPSPTAPTLPDAGQVPASPTFPPATSRSPTPSSSNFAHPALPSRSGSLPTPIQTPSRSPSPRILPAPPGSVPASPTKALSPAPPAGSAAAFAVPAIPSGRHAAPPLPGPPSTSGRPPVGQPLPAALERSDTVSSVKSLDRSAFSSRPLPRPPVGVNSSRSLDRGVPASRGPGREAPSSLAARRKQPSVVREESEEVYSDDSSAAHGRPAAHGRAPAVPSISLPGDGAPSAPGSPSKVPAKFTPLPTINVPDSDSAPTTDDEAAAPPKVPEIVFAGLPTIAVSSSDTAEDTDAADIGPLVIAVPSLSLSSDDGPLRSVAPPARPRTMGQGAVPPTRIEATSAILCAGCGEPIIGRIVSAMGRRWHPQCFKCDGCGGLLEHVSSYEHDGKAYCHLDYHDRFAHRCHHCKTPIVDDRFITLADPVLGQRYYHELHFFCSECGDPFLDPSRSSAPGTEASRRNLRAAAGDGGGAGGGGGGGAGEGEGEADGDADGEGETNAFVIHRGHPYCERCHLRLHKPKCRACARPIPDVALGAMGAKWHAECFVCQNCAQPFANNLFFPKDGKAICTECFELA